MNLPVRNYTLRRALEAEIKRGDKAYLSEGHLRAVLKVLAECDKEVPFISVDTDEFEIYGLVAYLNG